MHRYPSFIALLLAASMILSCASGWAGWKRLDPAGNEITIEDSRAQIRGQEADKAAKTDANAFADWQAVEADPAAKPADKTAAKAAWLTVHAKRKTADSASDATKTAAATAKTARDAAAKDKAPKPK